MVRNFPQALSHIAPLSLPGLCILGTRARLPDPNKKSAANLVTIPEGLSGIKDQRIQLMPV
jgi:hypothetical protein